MTEHDPVAPVQRAQGDERMICVDDTAVRISVRKAEHLRYAMAESSQVRASAAWDELELIHRALPEVNLSEIDLSVGFLGRRLRLPLMISSMTGGHPDAEQINRRLGEAAERWSLPIGLGSLRAMIVEPTLTETYAIMREAAPTAFVFGNIGAPQLVPQPGKPPLSAAEVDDALRRVGANGLIIHLNFLQESVQLGGDTNAHGTLDAIARIVAASALPVIVKETGAGLSTFVARQLADAGVAALDVGGSGGTSMAGIEAERARSAGDGALAAIGDTFAAWGIPTIASIRMARRAGLPVIASGGVRSGLDAAKAGALGAQLVAMARPFLEDAARGDDALDERIRAFERELRTACFLTGSDTYAALRDAQFLSFGTTRDWIEAADRMAGEV